MKPGDTLIVSFEQTMRLNPGDYLLSFGCAGFDSDKYTVYDRRFDVIPFQVIHDKSAMGMFDMNSTVYIQHIEKE